MCCLAALISRCLPTSCTTCGPVGCCTACVSCCQRTTGAEFGRRAALSKPKIVETNCARQLRTALFPVRLFKHPDVLTCAQMSRFARAWTMVGVCTSSRFASIGVPLRKGGVSCFGLGRRWACVRTWAFLPFTKTDGKFIDNLPKNSMFIWKAAGVPAVFVDEVDNAGIPRV